MVTLNNTAGDGLFPYAVRVYQCDTCKKIRFRETNHRGTIWAMACPGNPTTHMSTATYVCEYDVVIGMEPDEYSAWMALLEK